MDIQSSHGRNTILCSRVNEHTQRCLICLDLLYIIYNFFKFCEEYRQKKKEKEKPQHLVLVINTKILNGLDQELKAYKSTKNLFYRLR